LADRAPSDRLLPGEDPTTASAAEADRWHVAYGELIAAKDSLIGDLARSMTRSGADAQIELSSIDEILLQQQRDRFVRRRAFWQQRKRELRGQ
jgi:hypothetical protein